MDLGDSDLWSLPADMRQPFAIQDLSSVIGYYGLGGSNGYAAANGSSREVNESLNGIFSETQADLDLGQGFLPDRLSPNNGEAVRPASQGTAPTSMSSESPSDAIGLANQMNMQSSHFDDGFARRTSMTRLGTDHAHLAHASSWPVEFSLEARKGYSNHLIGLSCESDPFLLRHYKYNAYDNYQMFRLDFRRVVNDAQSSTSFDIAGSEGQPFTPNIPLQFMMSDEAIWKEDLKATERYLSSGGTEAADLTLLNKIVDPELGRSLVKL